MKSIPYQWDNGIRMYLQGVEEEEWSSAWPDSNECSAGNMTGDVQTLSSTSWI